MFLTTKTHFRHNFVYSGLFHQINTFVSVSAIITKCTKENLVLNTPRLKVEVRGVKNFYKLNIIITKYQFLLFNNSLEITT